MFSDIVLPPEAEYVKKVINRHDLALESKNGPKMLKIVGSIFFFVLFLLLFFRNLCANWHLLSAFVLFFACTYAVLDFNLQQIPRFQNFKKMSNMD